MFESLATLVSELKTFGPIVAAVIAFLVFLDRQGDRSLKEKKEFAKVRAQELIDKQEEREKFIGSLSEITAANQTLAQTVDTKLEKFEEMCRNFSDDWKSSKADCHKLQDKSMDTIIKLSNEINKKRS